MIMSNSKQTTALITGANKGLGYETARRLGALDWRILIGSRDPERGREAAEKLAADGLDVSMVPLDVTSDASVRDAAAAVAKQTDRLDVLINNAAIAGRAVGPADTTADDLAEVFATNVFGPVRVTRAFLPLLRAAEHPRVVMVSSGLGSLALTQDPERIESTVLGLPYPSSKSALNMITTQYARAIPEIRFNAVDPGYTATDLNGNSGHQTVTEGTDAIVELATAGPDQPTGTYTDRHGPLPW